MSSIEWTDVTWNPVIGCSRVSEGCRNCYAETMASRLSAMGQEAYQGLTTGTGRKARWTGVMRFMPDRLALPLRWKKPRRIFVNSMSDLFHPGLTFEQIAAVFGVMAACPQHTFQVLTKRPERAVEFFAWVAEHGSDAYTPILHAAAKTVDPELWSGVMYDTDLGRDLPECEPWPLPNVWLGVSVENQSTADERIPPLLHCPAAVRWVSAEPLLGAVDLHNENMADRQDHDWLTGLRYGREDDGSPFGLPDGARINWVVVGGESGPGARPMHPDWARSLRDQCQAAGVPFLFKQWGAWAPRDDMSEAAKARTEFHDWHGMTGTTSGMVRVGKKAAGRLLDGVEWNEYPKEAGRG